MNHHDFVYADMMRKYIQMAFTRARHYGNYMGGKKHEKDHGYQLVTRGAGQQKKANTAAIFFAIWK